MADIDALVSRIKNELRTEIKDEFVGELRQLQNKNEQLEAELQTLRDKNAVEDEWLEAADSRNAGTIDLPENLRHLFHQDSIHHRKEIRTVYKVLSDYPEPRGGWLRPQEMDSYTVSDEYKNNEDKALMDAQRFVLQGIKPSILVDLILNNPARTELQKLEDIRTLNLESIKLHLHFAQEIRVARRVQAARKFNLVPKSEAHERMGSSDDSLLFGPELKKVIADEKSMAALQKNANAQGKVPPGGIQRGKPNPSWRGRRNPPSRYPPERQQQPSLPSQPNH